MSYVNFNGSILKESNVNLSFTNRAFRYGDSIFETIRLINGIPININAHYDRLSTGVNALHYKNPFSIDDLKLYLSELAENNLVKEGRARVTIYREGKGRYTPETNQVSFLIEIKALLHRGFQFNDKGISLGIFDEVKVPIHSLSNLKTGNALCYVLAGVYCTNIGYDDCLLLNENGKIVEAISSNLFLVKNDVLYTPSPTSGCVLGTMRKAILQIGKKHFKDIKETTIDIKKLEEADEVFLTNAISGIIWVKECKGVIYKCNLTKSLFGKLVETFSIS